MIIDVNGFLPGISAELLDSSPWTARTSHPSSKEMPETMRCELFMQLACRIMKAQSMSMLYCKVINQIPEDPLSQRTNKKSLRFTLWLWCHLMYFSSTCLYPSSKNTMLLTLFAWGLKTAGQDDLNLIFYSHQLELSVPKIQVFKGILSGKKHIWDRICERAHHFKNQSIPFWMFHFFK